MSVEAAENPFRTTSQIRTIVNSLNSEIGPALVSLAVADTGHFASLEWQKPGAELPNLSEEKRLFALAEAWLKLSQTDSERAHKWLTTLNPFLNSATPIGSLRSDRFEHFELAVEEKMKEILTKREELGY